MPTKQQIAAAYNAAIAQGLTPDAAAEAAGISDANFGDFQENDNGRIEPLSISAATRSTNTPNWTSESADEDEEGRAEDGRQARRGSQSEGQSGAELVAGGVASVVGAHGRGDGEEEERRRHNVGQEPGRA